MKILVTKSIKYYLISRQPRVFLSSKKGSLKGKIGMVELRKSFFRFARNREGPGGSFAAGRGSGHSAGGQLPQGNVQRGAALAKNPLPDPGREDSTAGSHQRPQIQRHQRIRNSLVRFNLKTFSQ